MSADQRTKKWKGYIMLFGFFRVRRDFAFFQEISPPAASPNTDNNSYLKRLEPWLQKWCTIKWVEFKEGDKELCYH